MANNDFIKFLFTLVLAAFSMAVVNFTIISFFQYHYKPMELSFYVWVITGCLVFIFSVFIWILFIKKPERRHPNSRDKKIR